MSGFAISGKAGSGKTTMGKHLLAAAEAHGVPAVKIAFGDELKREVMELYGIDKQMVGGRDALIRHGEARRSVDPYYWIRPVANRVRLAQVSGLLSIVDDMRFETEYWWAVFYGGLIPVRMVASPEWRRTRLLDQGLDPSIVGSDSLTETQLDCQDHQYVVRNHAGAKLAERAAQLIVSTL